MSSAGAGPPPGVDPSGLGPEVRPSLIERYGLAQRAEGLLAPLLTTVFAFFVGGLVVLVTTGKNPLTTYRAIFEGAGLSWFFEVGSYRIGLPFSDATVWFPWNVNDFESLAAVNLQQTLIATTTLILTGLAVAFAFRCGMFNIGGQGQYIVGGIWAVWIGSSFEGLNPFLHITLAIVVATLAGAAWAGIAGFLKATVGAHEVISTIMLNWIAIWIGSFLFGVGGPLQNDQQASVPISNDVVEGAKLPIFWGDPLLQGLHTGIFVAIGALIVYWAVLNRTTLGFGVRAVGFNPEAARYGGIGVRRNYFLAMAISGAFAGTRRRDRRARLAVPPCDRGREYGQPDRVHRHRRRAPRPEHRGRCVSGGPPVRLPRHGHVDTKPRSGDLPARARLQPHAPDPGARRPLRRSRHRRPLAAAARAHEGDRMTSVALPVIARLPSGFRRVAWIGIVIGLIGAWLALPPVTLRSWVPSLVLALIAVMLGTGVAIRGERRFGGFAIASGVLGFAIAYLATLSGLGKLESVVVWSALLAAMLRYATPLVFASLGGMFSERSGVVNIALEGMMLMGAFFAILAADKLDSWWLGLLIGILAGGAAALVHAVFSIHLRADQIVSGTAINFLAVGLTGYLFIDIYGTEGTPTDIPSIPNVHLGFLGDGFVGDIFGRLNLMIWIAIVLVPLTWAIMFKTPIGLRIRACGEHPQGRGHGRDQRLRRALRRRDRVGDARGGGGRLPLDRIRQLVQREHDRGTRVHRARRVDLRELAAVRRRGSVSAVRVLERACPAPARVLPVGGGALPGVAVRPDAHRRRGSDRPIDPACRRRPSVPEAVVGAGMATTGEVRASGNGRAIAAVVLGLLATATMPAAIVATRYSESYELAPRRLRDPACTPARHRRDPPRPWSAPPRRRPPRPRGREACGPGRQSARRPRARARSDRPRRARGLRPPDVPRGALIPVRQAGIRGSGFPRLDPPCGGAHR